MYWKELSKQKTLLSLSLSLGILLNSGCAHQEKKPFTGNIYVGDSTAIAVKGNKHGNYIACEDKQFDGMVCMTKEEFAQLVDSLLSTKK